MNASKNISLVLTVIGDDRPGLVEQLASAISAHEGSWCESSMSHLAGKFAGIVAISVPDAEIDALKATLAALPGLRVTAEASRPAGPAAGETGTRRLKLALVGHDRIGIVREVSQVLARHAVNVEDLSTHTASAPMSADSWSHNASSAAISRGKSGQCCSSSSSRYSSPPISSSNRMPTDHSA